MKYWIIHTPDGDQQVCTEDTELVGIADNPDAYPVTEVTRHGHWHERWDRVLKTWVPKVTKEEVERVEWESKILHMNNLELYKLLEEKINEVVYKLTQKEVIK